MGDGITLGYKGNLGWGREDRDLFYGIVLRILGNWGYLREGNGRLILVPGVPGVPEGGQVRVMIQLGLGRRMRDMDLY